MVDNLNATVCNFFRMIACCMFHQDKHSVANIIGEMAYEPFRHTAESAGAMDGWHSRGLAYLSREVCEQVALMFKLIGNGSPWPISTRYARVVYFENAGVAIGDELQTAPNHFAALPGLGRNEMTKHGKLGHHLGLSGDAGWRSQNGSGRCLAC